MINRTILSIFLLVTFSFAQTNISSKYIIVPISQNTSQIDFLDYITLQDNELYTITPFYLEDFSNNCPDNLLEGWDLEFQTNLYSTSNSMHQDFEIDYDCEDFEDTGVMTCRYFIENPDIVINSENSIISGSYQGFYDVGCSIFTGDLYFRVTGVFEEDIMPETGDMNNDGIIDILDIVAMVNVIMGGFL